MDDVLWLNLNGSVFFNYFSGYTGPLRTVNTCTCWWRHVWEGNYGPSSETGQLYIPILTLALQLLFISAFTPWSNIITLIGFHSYLCFFCLIQRFIWRFYYTILHGMCSGGFRLSAFQRHYLQRPQTRKPYTGPPGLCQTGKPISDFDVYPASIKCWM